MIKSWFKKILVSKEKIDNLSLNKKLFIKGFIVGALLNIIFLILFSFIAYYWEEINRHLVNISTGNDGQLFMTMAASIVGVLALTFSLAIFSIQHASDKGTAKVLSDYKKDPVYKVTFILMASFSITLFVFSILPFSAIWIFYEYSIAFIFLTITFILLNIVYKHTIDLVDPINRIVVLYNKIDSWFLKTTNTIKTLIKEHSNSISTDNTLDSQEKKDIFTTGIFQRMPAILNPIRINMNDIFDVIREYIPRKKYDITATGYRAIIASVSLYFKTRKRSTEFANLFTSSNDSFMTDVYEKLTALNKISLQSKDLQGAKQNLDSFKLIAMNAIDFKPVNKDASNFTCNMAMGYMKGNILEGMMFGLDDIALDGSRHIGEIALKTLKEYHLTIASAIGNLQEIAFNGIFVRKNYIVENSIQSLMDIYNEKMDTAQYKYDQITIGSNILDAIKYITINYLKSGLEVSHNCYGLSPAFSIINENSFPYFISKYLDNVNLDNFEDDLVKDFFHIYMDIGEQAGEKESFLILFLIQGINMVLENALNTFSNKNSEDKKKFDKILNELIWLTSVYWRIYNKQPRNYESKHIEFQAIENLTGLALRSIELGLEDFAKKLCGQIFEIASISIEKKSNEFTAPRIIFSAIKIGVVARSKNMNSLADYVITKTEEFQNKFVNYHKTTSKIPNDYFEKYEQSLSTEMWRLYTDFNNYRTKFLSSSIFYDLVKKEEVKKYLNEIELKIYEREITDIKINSIY